MRSMTIAARALSIEVWWVEEVVVDREESQSGILSQTRLINGTRIDAIFFSNTAALS